MSLVEHLTPEGFRVDGRRADELRHVQLKIGHLSTKADGSAMVQLGNTKVLCYVYGPTESNFNTKNSTTEKVHCVFSSAAFKSTKRKMESSANRVAITNASCIRDIFSSLILVEKYPRSRIDIYITVLEDDGGVLATAINATMASLVDAGIPVKDFVSSASVGLLGQTCPLVDLNNTELNSAAAELTLSIYNRTQTVTSLDLYSKVSLDKLDEMYSMAVSAARDIAYFMQNTLKEHFCNLFAQT